MTRTFLAFLFLILPAVLSADEVGAPDPLPIGAFEGGGKVWNLDGKSEPYRVQMTFRGSCYEEAWASPSRSGRLDVCLTYGENRQVTVKIKGSDGPITGYCAQSACHFEGIATNGSQYEQTLWFEGDRIRKVGSETFSAGGKIHKTMWVSTLTRGR